MASDANTASPARRSGPPNMAHSKPRYSTVEVTEIITHIDAAPSPSHKTPTLSKSSTTVTAAELFDLPRASHPHMTETARTMSPSTRAAASKRKRPTSSLSSSSPSPPRTPRSQSSSGEGQTLSDHSRVYVHSPWTNKSPLASRRGSETGFIDQKTKERKREDLLALHRESCRLFQDAEVAPGRFFRRDTGITSLPVSPTQVSFSSATRGFGGSRTSSELGGSPIASPLLPSQRQPPLQLLPLPAMEEEKKPFLLDQHDSTAQLALAVNDNPADLVPEDENDEDNFAHLTTPTVIDWTSPSTRKREYEKIDRANRGVRKLWHRVAPKWISAGDSRMPFFEEGRDGRGNYEGSVRRFRMDIPDDESDSGSELEGSDGDGDDAGCEKQKVQPKGNKQIKKTMGDRAVVVACQSQERGQGRRRRPRWLCLGVETLKF